jgi:hypothetical protein
MKILRFILLLVVPTVLGGNVFAAPIESVESARASVAFQKVDAFLSEKAVANQLQSLGMSREKAQARLASLDQTQIDQLAAQIDLIRVGGTIEHSDESRLGPLGCMWKQIGVFFYDVYQLIFCWGDLK